MRYAAHDLGSDRIIDRRHETGLKGWASNAARSVGDFVRRGGPLGKPALPQAPEGGEPLLPLPTMESAERWPPTEDLYRDENFHDFEPLDRAEIQKMESLRKFSVEARNARHSRTGDRVAAQAEGFRP